MLGQEHSHPIGMATQHTPRQSKRSALLIGINQYNSLEVDDLSGALFDVANTEKFLTEVFVDTSIAITKLTSPPLPNQGSRAASFDNIRSAFETLTDNAESGDFIYIHFSGHGIRKPTKFRDLKGDSVSYDECLVLARTDGKVDLLRDVEIAFLLKRIADKGATITLILDCCHSGGATRGDADKAVRGVESSLDARFINSDRALVAETSGLEATWGPPPVRYDGNQGRGGTVIQHWMTASQRINFLAACLPQQKALEVTPPGMRRSGLLTHCLRSVVQEALAARQAAQAARQETRQEAREDSQEVQQEAEYLSQLSFDVVYNLVFNKVKNFLENDTSGQDVVFGGQGDCHIFGVESVVQPTIAVKGVNVLDDGRVQVVLSAGLAHGVREDDIFAIYPRDSPLTTLADYSSPLATCRVRTLDIDAAAVNNFTSNAIIQSRGANLGQIAVGCRAVGVHDVLKKCVFQYKGVSVLSADNSTRSLDNVVQRVQGIINYGGKLLRLENSGGAFFKVLVRGDDIFTISFTPNQAEATVEVVGEAAILPNLIHLAIFYNLFGLANTQRITQFEVNKIGYLEEDVDPPEPEGFQLEHADPPPTWRTDLMELPRDSINIFSGQRLGIEVRNKSREEMYVEILDLEPSWAVTRVYPMPSQSPILVSPNEGKYFFIKMGLSANAAHSSQPDTFDRFVVVATSRNGLNFPRDMLPMLGGGVPAKDIEGSDASLLLRPDNEDGGRQGDGVPPRGWWVQQFDVRVVA
jgi:hypothetical protein